MSAEHLLLHPNAMEEEAPPLRRHRALRAHHRNCHPFWSFALALALCAFVLHLDHVAKSGEEVCATLPQVFTALLTGYGASLIIAGGACFTACCAGQFGCLALQAAVLDLFIVLPVNFTLYILYRLLMPLRIAWTHLLCWIVVPFVSFFEIRPKFSEATIGKFVLALPIAFRYMGMGDIYTATEFKVRRDMRRVMQTVFPRLRVPDVILTNTLFRLLLGFIVFPLAWWLVDEMYCVPFSKAPSKPAIQDAEEEDLEEKAGVAPTPQAPLLLQEEDDGRALDVSFVFPKCKFLVEARKTYMDRVAGDKVCRRACKILVEELTGQLIGHAFQVEPNLKTCACTFSLTTATASRRGQPTTPAAAAVAEKDKTLEW